MGEVHVKVRLSNAIDTLMAFQGTLAPNDVRSCEVDAIVDTGTTKSVIPPYVAAQLGLQVVRQAKGTLTDGSRITAGVSGAVSFKIEDRETVEDAYILGNHVLIGQTVLESTDLLVDCSNRKVIPNPAHPEGPLFRF